MRRFKPAKTKRCKYCEGRYKIEKMTHLFTHIESQEEWWCCWECKDRYNLKAV